MTFVYTLGDVVGLSLVVILLIGFGVYSFVQWIRGKFK